MTAVEQAGQKCTACQQELGPTPLPCVSCSSANFCSLRCVDAGLAFHPWECCLKEGVSQHILDNQFLQNIPNHFRLGFRLLVSATTDQLKSAVDNFLTQSGVDFSVSGGASNRQKEADFTSLLNLCGWDSEARLDEDFWVFIFIALYLGNL